jgi:superfamily I DNA and/or RNA helicase
MEKTDLQKKVVRLFTYLEKALSLDDIIVRDFRSTVVAPSPWWIADLPTEAENLFFKKLENNIAHDEIVEEADVLLRVEKKNVKVAPLLPDPLVEWVAEIVPTEPPKAKEKIDRKVLFKDDDARAKAFKTFNKEFEQGDQLSDVLTDWVVLSPTKAPEIIEERYVEERFEDHPELQNLLNGYIENDWQPWADKVIEIYKANLLYDQLYALRLLLKNEGDGYELLWGNGLLAWKNKRAGTICAPIFLTPLTLDFDASKRVIEVSPDPMFRGFVEISSLYETENPAEMDLITWADKINSDPFDFWHLETLKLQSRFLVNTLSPDSEDNFEDEMSSSPNAADKPSIWNAPVIFARKRNNDLWSKYAGFIRRDIEQNQIEPTDFIADLVGDYEEKNIVSVAGEERRQENDNSNVSIPESELFFPLPWNDEQKRIAERLEAHYGVVVKGPPGTGKSHTIANLISRFLAEGKTVLVTAQTSKALEVLRDKLPENIRSLAVSQLYQTARRDQVLQESIGEISSNLGERQTKFSEHRAASCRDELQQVREEKALLANEIRQYILSDSQATIKIDGEDIKPIDAAKLISKHKDDPALDWFTDKVRFEDKLSFSESDLEELYSLLQELDREDRGLSKIVLPELEKLPDEEKAAGVLSAYKDLSAKSKASEKTFGAADPNLDQGELSILVEQLQNAKGVLSSMREDYEREIFHLCILSQGEREKWRIFLTKANEKIREIGTTSAAVLGHEVVGKSKLDVDALLDAVVLMKKKLEGAEKFSTFSKLLLPSNAKTVLENYTVDGRVPLELKRLNIFEQELINAKAKKELLLLLAQVFSKLKSSPKSGDEEWDLVEVELLIANLDRLVNYCDRFSEVDVFCKSHKVLAHFSFTNLENVEELFEVLSSHLWRFELKGIESILNDWTNEIENSTSKKRHQIWDALLVALNEHNAAAWNSTLESVRILIEKKEKAIRLDDLTEKIKPYCPSLYADIAGLAEKKIQFDCPKNLPLAWKIGQLQSWLGQIHDHVSIDELQKRLERLTKKEYQLNSDLITILAWQRQIDRVTKKQRDALMAWSHEMKKYGKGTGKYAVTHLKQAQDALKEARSAVPVWIMPLHRAAQMFAEPKAGMFDVVIFDEASQCDIKGLTIGYLGKKLLVVGDPEQISPAGIFQDQEKVFELISRFLFDIPFKDTFSITSSLFDLAKIRLSNIIQLNEHFRCVPEIIAFSNRYVYEGKLKILRYPQPKGLLAPALVPVFVENGYQNKNNKVNVPEAEAIVEKLAELIADPAYQKRPDGRLCTFGVISLLAEDQAKYLKDLILKRFDEKTIEERRIVCGDAYAFQGDERDVIMLSMVKALDPNNPEDTVRPMVDEGAKRRFNVAASRARDQMFLYHSIPVDEFKNPDDWRYKLLNWFYHPQIEELKAGREALKREFDAGRASQFSVDVGNLLIDRGYCVIPEYPVIGYRIDLVVQGDNARLAVECDGDQYHTLETWENDQVRERQLRRAGWEFWRVTGSAFYLHKEGALDTLWSKLKEMGISPLTETYKN